MSSIYYFLARTIKLLTTELPYLISYSITKIYII